ncbi:MAG: PTS sugar transporter subunit IIA [Eubacteriales bacterium]|nr:PTS sugar transporter subunit IIA [Eubacteriales bacterium]
MILDMLKQENVQIVERVSDWKEAIAVSLQSLEEQNYVTKEYGESIIRITEEMGPYYVLTEDVALIHGRPESGVREKQLAITVLRNPIQFSENSYPVRLLVALAATDPESHLSVMQTLAELFMSEGSINDLVNAEDAKQVYEYLVEFDRKVQS